MTSRASSSGPPWAAVEPLLDRALELAPAEQDVLIEHTRTSDPALAAEVTRLVYAGRRVGGFLEEPAAAYAEPLLAWAVEQEPLEPGASLDRYEIIRRLGRGATATVYQARDDKHHRVVAIKVLHPDLAQALGSERFLREIEIAATLHHPHILPLFDSGAADGLLFYVMPHVEGESLRSRLRDGRRLPLTAALRIAREVAGALDYSHRHGVVHRDIKPENILLQDGQAVVADFGIARAIDAAAADFSESGGGTGTPAYMSPEQRRRGAVVDGRTDVYSLGCVLYEMLAGAPPFDGRSAEEIGHRQATGPSASLVRRGLAVPTSIDFALARALAAEPDARFATAGAFAEALGSVGQLEPARRRTRALVVAGGVLGVAGIVGAAVLWPRGPQVVAAAERIAVLPFEPADADTGLARLGEDLAGTVNVTLDRLGGISTVDRFATLTSTASVQRPRSVGEALAIGRRFGAGSVLTGNVARLGDNVRIEATLLRSDRPVPMARAIVVAPAESLSALTDSVTLQLVRQIWLERAPPTPSLAAVTTRSVPALRSFLDGERAMLAANWREAADDYHAAFEADSGFTLSYARYAEAVTWRRDDHVFDEDPEVRRHMRAGRFKLPERDRLLADARLANPSTRLDLLREVTRRYPDYWPGWFYYGDALLHAGPLHGHSWAEARAALRHALALNSDLVSAWEHLSWISAEADPAAYKESINQLVRLGYYANRPDGAADLRGNRLMEGVGRNNGGIPMGLRSLADSVARDRATLPFELFRWSVLGELGLGFPATQIEIDRRLLDELLSREKRAEVLRSLALSWAARGVWDSALVELDRFVALGASPSAASHAYSLTVLGAWLGVLEPDQAARRRAAAEAALPTIPDDARPVRLLCLYWLDGVLAFVRRDRAALAEARNTLTRLHSRQGDMNADILSAFARALDGHEAEAGRRLAAIEWKASDLVDEDGSRYDFLITRMSAAKWLAGSGHRDEAIRLLRAANTIGFAGKMADTYVAAAPAQLALARLLEAQGDRVGALEAYRQFLRRVDLPMPSQRPLVIEAKAALARLESRKTS